MSLARPEEQIQKSIVRYLAHALPEGALCWHTPNQRGTRKKWEVALLKGLGVVAGIPDLLILCDGQLYGLEIKAPGRYVTDNQQLTQARLVAAGAKIATARSVEDAERALRGWGVPLRATVLVAKALAA